MLSSGGPFRPFRREQFEFLGGDAFDFLQRWQLAHRRGLWGMGPPEVFGINPPLTNE